MAFDGSQYEARIKPAFSSTSTQELTSCDICGRNFNPSALQRHITVCQKAAMKKRKVFDSAKQRAAGTDIVLPKNRPKPGQPPPVRSARAPTGSQSAPQPIPKTNWRAKHEDFVNTIRAARGVQKAMASGAPLPPPPPPSINPDYVQCPYCSRRFNQSAAQRHINFCKEQQSRLPNKKSIDATAQHRAEARKKYSSATRGGRNSTMSMSNRSNYSVASHTSGVDAPSARGGAGLASGYNASRYTSEVSETPSEQSHQDDDSSDGRVLRTGRTSETYSEARKLSSTQRAGMTPSRGAGGARTPQNSGSSRYGSSGSGSIHSTEMTPVTGKGYNSSNGDLHNQGPSHASQGQAAGRAKFCHECGTKFAASGKFCHNCGAKRL